MSVSRLVGGLAARGIDVTVIAPGSAAEWQPRPGVKVISVPGEERWGLIRNFRRWRSGVQRVLTSVHPDIVHGQGLPVPGAAAVGSGTVAPCVITAHGSARHDTSIGSNGKAARARSLMLRFRSVAAIRAADAVIGVHPDWRVNLPKPTAGFVYIPNIVDAAYYAGRRRPVRGRVLFSGGSRKIKGWDVLAAAWPSVEAAVLHAHLSVVGWWGDPPIEIRGSVAITGQLASQQMVAAMEQAEVVVIPSRYEVAPVVLAEAWALGVPVVATSVGGIPTLAEGAAVLVPSEDPRALAEALIGVLNGAVACRGLVLEGAKRAQAFSAEAVVGAHLRLYEELLARP